MIERNESAALLRTVGAVVEVVVRGRSMEPTLLDGERVRIRCGRPASVGQVSAWMAGDNLVSHRVLWVREDGVFMTQGDGVALPDPPLRPELNLGVVEAVLREGRWEPLGDAPHQDTLLHRLGRFVAVGFRVGSTLTLWLPRVAHALLHLLGRVIARGRGRPPTP